MKILRIVTPVLISALVILNLSFAQTADRDRTLVIGKVSPNPKKHYDFLKPIGEYVVKQMHDLGIDRVKVLMAKDSRQMMIYLKQGDVDWVTDTIFTAVEFEDQADAEILLLKHKKGVAAYNAVFFTRRDSGIKSIKDLKGKVVAFEDSGSTSAFFIPAAIMLDAGLKMKWLKSPRQPVPSDTVGYVFAKAEINMSTWVNKGLVHAGAFSNLDWLKEDHTPSAFRENMEIFHQSASFPRAIELVRKGLRPEVKQRLKSILLKSHRDPDADFALDAYQGTTRFDDIDESISNRADDARHIISIVKESLVF